jgi:hypothetical protein
VKSSQLSASSERPHSRCGAGVQNKNVRARLNKDLLRSPFVCDVGRNRLDAEAGAASLKVHDARATTVTLAP